MFRVVRTAVYTLSSRCAYAPRLAIARTLTRKPPQQQQLMRVVPSRQRYEYYDNRGQTWSQRLWQPRTLVIAGGATGLAGIYYVTHLDKVEITGRTRMIAVNQKTEVEMGDKAFEVIKAQYQGKILPETHEYVKAVKRVGMRLVNESGVKELKDYNWEFVVVQDEQANAFVLPGGKVVVFTGIIPIMKNQDGLAIVLGHEIGHVIARHGAERMSLRTPLFLLQLALSALLGSGEMSSWITTLLLELPFSRNMETEADRIGLILVARACYNLREAAPFWRRMEENTHGSKSRLMGYLQTHPAHENRIKDIQEYMPKAQAEAQTHCGDLHAHGYGQWH